MKQLSCDVLVIGGGPAGIAAAARAAAAGAATVLVDEGIAPGGQIWRPNVHGAQPALAQRWLARLAASGATVMPRTTVVDVERRPTTGFVVRAEQNAEPVAIASRALVLATGARERFLPFPGWTLPNVIGIGGAQALLKSGTSFRGKHVLIAGTGPLLLPVAASLTAAGATLQLVAEQSSRGRVARFAAGLWNAPATLAQAARYRMRFFGVPYAMSAWVVRAEGDDRLRRVIVQQGRETRAYDCDVLCTGYGLVPNTELARLLGCAMRGNAVTVDADQGTTIDGVFAAGEPTGVAGVDSAVAEGQVAGLAAAGRADEARSFRREVSRRAAHGRRLDLAFALRPEIYTLGASDTIVCRCEDVRLGQLDRGWTSRQAKLYTRAGMGPCQGRICGPALECLMGWSPDSARPPVFPAHVHTLSSPVATGGIADTEEHSHDAPA
ncbi:MAG TPA: FAD/NAD(P)-binding oxidoreductase [Gemmatimonadaceae bacterium]|nr:FAD/NAD(P)-binding oxidoreductase [Gemmatimonadaceae bacterium]